MAYKHSISKVDEFNRNYANYLGIYPTGRFGQIEKTCACGQKVIRNVNVTKVTCFDCRLKRRKEYTIK